MKTLKLIPLVILTTLSAHSVMAAETDQFYAAGAVIKDSTVEMNRFFQDKIEVALDEVNGSRHPVSCRYAAKEVLQQVVGEVNLIEWFKNRSFSKISKFTQKSPLIDRYPDDSVKGRDYRAHSIYRNRPFPVNVLGVARTLNINGIFIGTDKLGHFSIVGKTYYKNFLKAIEAGATYIEAENYAVLKGIKQEINLLGYAIGGTFSYGDMEANYQGLQFARNMCEGENPYLIQKNGQWIQNPANLFDIRKYVTPKYDEAYNVSFWSPRMWRKMNRDIIRGYCDNKKEPAFAERAFYYSKIVKTTTNDILLVEFVRKNPKFERNNQLLSSDISCEK